MTIRTRNFPDLIEAFEEGMRDSEIPNKFTRWAAISAIAGAMTKKCWYDAGAFKLYPNMFIILVGEPSTGKSISLKLPFNAVYKRLAVNPSMPKNMRDDKHKEYGLEHPLYIIGDKITPHQLQVEMSAHCRQEIFSKSTFDNKPNVQSAVTLTTSEMGTFITRNSHDVQMFMTEMWDAKEDHGDYTKTQGKFPITEPCLNWICCATPSQFVENLPENVMGQGLMTRLMIVPYDGPSMGRDIYYTAPSREGVEKLVEDLAQIANMYGEFEFENPNEVRSWVRNGMEPEIRDPIMLQYNERRVAKFLKLCIIISAARRNDFIIKDEDWQRARDIIIEEEKGTPKVLENFGISKGAQIIRDVLNRSFSKQKGVISLIKFKKILLDRVKSVTEVPAYIAQMEQAGLIQVDENIVRKR